MKNERHAAPTGSFIRALALVGQAGFVVVAGLAVGLAGGWGLDRWLGTHPGLMIAGMLVGLAGGVLSAYRLLTDLLDPSRASGSFNKPNDKKE